MVAEVMAVVAATAVAERLAAVFAALRPIYAAYEARCVVLHDEPGKYYLGTHELRAKDGYRTWFGGIEIKQRYVAAHLIPVYAHPELLEGISPALRRRMQGKSCFNFAKLDEALASELAALVEAGFRRFEAEGRFE